MSTNQSEIDKVNGTTTDGSVTLSLDNEARTFLTQLHHFWSNRAPASAYGKLRDDLLLQREQVDARVTALSTVARIACHDALDADSHWLELILLAKSIEEGGERRKKAYREANRLRNYCVAAALWSPQLLLHYGWDKVGQTQMYALRACATRYPRFTEDFCPRLNSVLLARHRQGIKDGRTKTLNEATVQIGRDLSVSALASTRPNRDEIEPWLTDESGQFPLEPGGPWLSQLRPKHFRSYLLEKDRYGVLIARDRGFSQQTHLQKCPSPRDSPMPQSRSLSTSSQSANTSWTNFPISGESTSLVESPQALSLELPGLSTGTSQALDSAFHFQSDPFMGASPERIRTPGDNLSRLGEPVGLHCGWHSDDHDPSPLHISDFNDTDADAWMAPRDGYPLNAILTTPDITRPSSAVSQGSRSEAQSDGGMESDSNSDFQSTRDINMNGSTGETPALLTPSTSIHSAKIGGSEARAEKVTRRRAAVGMLSLRRGPATRRRAQQSELLATAIESPSLTPAHSTIEEVLQSRYHDLLKQYVSKLANEARHAGASQQQKSRAQWLGPDTKWASIWTYSNGELPRGSAGSADEADVHYYASDDFIAAARKGQIFDKPTVIKEKFTDSGMHTVEGVASLLQDAPSDAVIEVRKLDDFQPASIPVDDFVTGIRTNRLEGVNALNMRNLTNCHQPLFTMLFRFRLLQSLIGRAEGRSLAQSIISTPVGVASCTSFNILGLAGAFLGPRLDNLCGTWMRNLAGVNFWMIIPQQDMESQWDSFAASGYNWVPNGKERLLLLEQDDVLLLPPGLRVVDAVHSPVNCLIEGGMVWDDLNIVQTLESVRWICKYQATPNDPIASHLPVTIGELEKLVKEQPNRFRGRVPKATFLRKFDEAVASLRDLGCDCLEQDCDEWCECRQEGRGCTAWCTQHSQIRSPDCMEE